MRNPNRIPFILQKIKKLWITDKNKLLNKYGIGKDVINKTNIDEIEKLWIKSPDLRLGQLLVNNGVHSDYNFEGDEILDDGELIWTSVMDKQGKALKQPITKQIGDLDKAHLLAIIGTQYLSEKYLNAIFNILKLSKSKRDEYRIIQDTLYTENYNYYLKNISTLLETI